MHSVLNITFLVAIVTAFAVSPQNEKKLHGALCDTCKDIIRGGEDLGDADLDLWLNSELEVACDIVFFIHKRCKREIKKEEGKIKKAIKDKLRPEKACKDIDFC